MLEDNNLGRESSSLQGVSQMKGVEHKEIFADEP